MYDEKAEGRRNSKGELWKIAGYSNPRSRTHGPVYRLIRMSDGARVRIMSNKFYRFACGKDRFDSETNVPTGHDERAHGGNSAKIEDDHVKVGYSKSDQSQ